MARETWVRALSETVAGVVESVEGSPFELKEPARVQASLKHIDRLWDRNAEPGASEREVAARVVADCFGGDASSYYLRSADGGDVTLRVGRVESGGKLMLCLFNWDNTPQDVSCRLPAACRVMDVWTGDDLGRREGTLSLTALPPHAGRLLACTPEPARR